MSFTIRNASVEDASVLFEMTKEFHSEYNLMKRPYTNNEENFKLACFGKEVLAKFFIAEFNGSVLGYSMYIPIFNIATGASIIMSEIYVKKDYRKIGVFVFLFSKTINVAYKSNSYYIKWLVDISKNQLEIEEKIGVVIKKDLLVLNIYKDDIEQYLRVFRNNKQHEVRLAKSYELPDIFEYLKIHSLENDIELQTDIYKLMSAGYSSKPKFKILVVVKDTEVVGFNSFYEAYSPYCGKYLITDFVYVNKKYRNQFVGSSLMTGLFEYAFDNNYVKIETAVSKYEVEKIERLKEFGVYPYDNLRVATYKKEVFKELFNK